MKILLIVMDNDNYIHYFPIPTASIASILKKHGHEVVIYNQDINHWNETHLTRLLDNIPFDIVGIGSIAGYYPFKKLIKISEAINKSINRNKFKYVLGGHMPSADPNYFLNKMQANAVIKGEGETAIIDFCNTMKDGVYEAELIKDLDSLPQPAYDLFPIAYYRLQRLPNIENNEFSMSIATGRGCFGKCSFCYRISPGIRLRNINSIVEEIAMLKRYYGISYIDFADDLTLASKKRAVELSEALIPLNIKWRCEGRLDLIDKEILTVMKKSGCVFINYGIEALDDEVLKNIKKHLTVSQIINGIEATLKVGISPGLNIMFGNIGDNRETLKKAVEFLIKYDDGSQVRTIRPVTPYPGCELFNTAIEKGLLKNTADFYENKHINSDLITVNFTELSEDEYYKALYSANFQLLTNYHKKRVYKTEEQLKRLYIERDSSFRGYRHC